MNKPLYQKFMLDEYVLGNKLIETNVVYSLPYCFDVFSSYMTEILGFWFWIQIKLLYLEILR